MPQNSCESRGFHLSLTDIFVAVHSAAESDFGVVDVPDVYLIEANGLLDLRNRGLQTAFRADVIAGGKQMCGIEARSRAQRGKATRDGRHFFKTRAYGSAHSGGVFD